jgi:hypothetical protein
VKRATAYLEELLRGFVRKTDVPVGVTKGSSSTTSPVDFSDDDIEMLFKVMKPKTKNA